MKPAGWDTTTGLIVKMVWTKSK